MRDIYLGELQRLLVLQEYREKEKLFQKIQTKSGASAILAFKRNNLKRQSFQKQAISVMDDRVEFALTGGELFVKVMSS